MQNCRGIFEFEAATFVPEPKITFVSFCIKNSKDVTYCISVTELNVATAAFRYRILP